MDSNSASSYFCDDNFSSQPRPWAALLAQVLPKANYLELNRFLLLGPLPDLFREARVALPQQAKRVYKATHRFWLTPTLRAYCLALPYSGWQNGDFEDPAFYQDDQLLVGTITHENYVVLQLSETEKALLNEQGYDFRSQWELE